MVNGGGAMLLVMYTTELKAPAVMLTFQRSISLVVTGGIVSVVFSIVES